MGQRYVKLKGECGESAERTENKIGKNWLKRNQKRAFAGVLDSQTRPAAKFHKASNISHRRAKAASPANAIRMMLRIALMFSMMSAAGELVTVVPSAWQIWNGDEIGFDPNGKILPVSTLVQKGDDARLFNRVTGERAPFWATMFYFSCGDGRLPIPPMLVHQGGTEDTIPIHILTNMPMGWGYHATPSGYMDKEGFCALAKHFVLHSKATPDNPQFLFIDGHDSHWDIDALQYLLDHNVHVFFLKANDSINDQPNDMGPNAKLKSAYSVCYLNWRQRYPTVPYNVEYFNEVITKAWNLFASDPGITSIVLNAYKSAQLSPFPEAIVQIVDQAQSQMNTPMMESDVFRGYDPVDHSAVEPINGSIDRNEDEEYIEDAEQEESMSDPLSIDKDYVEITGGEDDDEEVDYILEGGETEVESTAPTTSGKMKEMEDLCYDKICDVLYPTRTLDYATEIFVGGGMSSKQKVAISESYLIGKDKATCERIRSASSGCSSHPLVDYRLGSEEDSQIQSYPVVISEMTKAFYSQSFVIPAQELGEEMANQKK
jgi:hypothetical protein